MLNAKACVRKPSIPFVYLIFPLLFSLPLIAQSLKPEIVKSGAPSFEVADVHVSPHRDSPYMRVSMAHDRLALRDVTMVDLVAIAHNVDSLSVLGGPALAGSRPLRHPRQSLSQHIGR